MGEKPCSQCGRTTDMTFEGECRDCYESRWHDYDDNDCANCGGEGFVSHCFEEWACMYPDEGCDLCMRRCDWCNPVKLTPEQQAERDALRQVLADALATPTKESDRDD